jgi:transposase
LFTKRLEQSRFFWPTADEATGSVMLTQAQLSMLIQGVDWRSPEKRWRPAVAG